MASRNEKKALAAISELQRDTGRQAIFLRLDLADLKSVRAAAQEFMRSVILALTLFATSRVELRDSKETTLHVLFNSGGVMFPPVEQLTADGYDLQFGTNVLG